MVDQFAVAVDGKTKSQSGIVVADDHAARAPSHRHTRSPSRTFRRSGRSPKVSAPRLIPARHRPSRSAEPPRAPHLTGRIRIRPASRYQRGSPADSGTFQVHPGSLRGCAPPFLDKGHSGVVVRSTMPLPFAGANDRRSGRRTPAVRLPAAALQTALRPSLEVAEVHEEPGALRASSPSLSRSSVWAPRRSRRGRALR